VVTGLDEGISRYVNILAEAGVETYECAVTVHFSIPGDPQALRRHRSARRGNTVVQYDDPANREPRERVQQAWQTAGHQTFPKGVPLALEITCHFKRPLSHFGTGRHSSVLKSSATWHVSRPDGSSNLGKLVEDSLNGIAWHDDSQIAKATFSKVYCSEDELPHTSVTVRSLDG
jgi:Holliday junction resolvase RusA-like endonuclease